MSFCAGSGLGKLWAWEGETRCEPNRYVHEAACRAHLAEVALGEIGAQVLAQDRERDVGGRRDHAEGGLVGLTDVWEGDSSGQAESRLAKASTSRTDQHNVLASSPRWVSMGGHRKRHHGPVSSPTSLGCSVIGLSSSYLTIGGPQRELVLVDFHRGASAREVRTAGADRVVVAGPTRTVAAALVRRLRAAVGKERSARRDRLAEKLMVVVMRMR